MPEVLKYEPTFESEKEQLVSETRKKLSDLNIDVAESQGAKIHEVKKGETLWGIIKAELGLSKNRDIANSVIRVVKVNSFNDTLKQDVVSVIDGKTINEPDGIPGDVIEPGDKIIIKIEDK